MHCTVCGQELPDLSRFCTRCGEPVHPPPIMGLIRKKEEPRGRSTEEMNMPILYGMMALLLLAVCFPPWETPPDKPPEFLGFHFILNPPVTESGPGIISRMLWTIDLVTIAIGGFYFSWLMRRKKGETR